MALNYSTIRFEGYNATANCKWHTAWEPVVDGRELTQEVWQLAQEGHLAPHVPVLLGVNANEGVCTTPPVTTTRFVWQRQYTLLYTRSVLSLSHKPMRTCNTMQRMSSVGYSHASHKLSHTHAQCDMRVHLSVLTQP